jgi:hypothetical protein
MIFAFLILDHFKATFVFDKVVENRRGLGLEKLIRGPTNSSNNRDAEHGKADSPLHLSAKEKKKKKKKLRQLT